MPWHCPHCDRDSGRPIFVAAVAGTLTVTAYCEGCKREWTVQRPELDMRHRAAAFYKTDDLTRESD
jgi:hypothetical protein